MQLVKLCGIFNDQLGEIKKMFRLPEGYEVKCDYEVSDIPIEGNCLVSGDDQLDRAAENAIMERLNRHDIWAWFDAMITVVHTATGIKGYSSLGACSYADQADFLSDDYYSDMVAEAYQDCINNKQSVRGVLNNENNENKY